MKLQPAVKTETLKVAKAEAAGVLLMFAVLFIAHFFLPDKLPLEPVFIAGVVISGIIGGAVAVLNFLMMGIAVQKVTTAGDTETGKKIFKVSYRNRMLIQIVWAIIALAVPFFHGLSGIVPLLIPTFVIRISGIRQALPIHKNTAEVVSDADETEARKGAD